MATAIEKLPFIINPSLRLRSHSFQVCWHVVDAEVLLAESHFAYPGRKVYLRKNVCEVMVQYFDGRFDIIYGEQTDWNAIGLQRWLRKEIRDAVVARANEILPARLHYWERQKGVRAAKVSVNPRLRRSTMGNCSVLKEINLAPMIVLFPLPFMDEVILHELAHLKYMHHRKSFWAHLSQLLGRDARELEKESDLFFSKYADLFFFLMKK